MNQSFFYIGWVGFFVLAAYMFKESHLKDQEIRAETPFQSHNNLNDIPENDQEQEPVQTYLLNDSTPSQAPNSPEKANIDFKIIVLTMNRLESLKRLLAALKASKYEHDTI